MSSYNDLAGHPDDLTVFLGPNGRELPSLILVGLHISAGVHTGGGPDLFLPAFTDHNGGFYLHGRK